MKLATMRNTAQSTDQPGGTVTAIITETAVDETTGAEHAVRAIRLEETLVPDVGALLALPEHLRQDVLAETLASAQQDESLTLDLSEFEYESLIPFPSKVFCIGLNYRNHIQETGLEMPEYPTVFTKFGQTLTGAHHDIAVPELDHRLDYEAELAVVIGAPAYQVSEDEADQFIAGYAVSNDISLRGMQGRTSEWTQGKIFEATTPVGPWLVTPDEFEPQAQLTTLVNGEVRQSDSVADLVFSPTQLVAYLSQIITLLPGDLILTGTPGGVALAMKDENGRRPWLKAGDVVETRIEGLGAQRNVIV